MTMTMMPTPTPTPPIPTASEHCCPNCGLSLPPLSDPHTVALSKAQRRIEDLESQIRLLNQKAADAVDRWADYEDELSQLRAASMSTSTSTSATTTSIKNVPLNRPHTPEPSVGTNSPRSSFLGAAAASRISQLLSPRKSALSSTATTPPQQQQRGSLSSESSTPPLETTDHRNSSKGSGATEMRELLAALTRERSLRAAAEEKLATTTHEIEDLTATLFEQANTMVASERRARAALEEHVSELERRHEEKRVRIERLEGAVRRIDNVRGVLGSREWITGVSGEGQQVKGEETEGSTSEGDNEKEEKTQRARDRNNSDTTYHPSGDKSERPDGSAKEGG